MRWYFYFIFYYFFLLSELRLTFITCIMSWLRKEREREKKNRQPDCKIGFVRISHVIETAIFLGYWTLYAGGFRSFESLDKQRKWNEVITASGRAFTKKEAPLKPWTFLIKPFSEFNRIFFPVDSQYSCFESMNGILIKSSFFI